MLKNDGFFGNKQVYIISPADLDFVQVDNDARKYAFNSASDFYSKVMKMSDKKNIMFIVDGVMLHSSLIDGFKQYETLYIDTLGLPKRYRDMIADVKVLRIKAPEILYKAISINNDDVKQILDEKLTLLPEYRHVIFGINNKVMTLQEYKDNITVFNDNDAGFFSTVFIPPRNLNNCDYLHIVKMLDPWDFEYLTTMLFRSTYTSKSLRVLFYVTEQETDKYNKIAEHLNEHLSYEDQTINLEPLIISNGNIKW